MRLIDADALIEDLEYDVELDAIMLDDMDFGGVEREQVQNDKDCKQSAIDLLQHTPTIEPEQQWIPCSEHPDTDRNVFIARGKTDFLSCCIGHYDHNAKLWYEDRNWFAKIMYDAMYWCEMPPLPEPWRGEEHGATL